MKRNIRLAVIVALTACASWSGLTFAADCANPRKAAGAMSEGSYKGVQEATELLTQNKHAQAVERLTKLLDSGSDFEKAVIYYNMGFAYSATENYGKATEAFAKALQLNALPQQQHEQLQYNLGQLYIAAGKPDDGIKTLQQYVNESCGKVPAEAHIFLANALSQAKRYKEAVPEIDRAIQKAGTAKESWLQLKLAINYELKDFKACAEALVGLIGMTANNAEYWRQLSSMFLQMKRDTDAVAVLALAERQGFLAKPAEVINLYNVYMMMDLPYKAGALLQGAVDEGKLPADEKHLDQIANAWINAREAQRAEATLKKLAATSERGEYYFKLGAMYGDNERWSDSKAALEKALQKGGLKRTGEAWMRMAVANHSLTNMPGTQAALQQAMKFDESRKQASEWLRYLGSSPTPQASTDQQLAKAGAQPGAAQSE
jgi:tetratricopeptide (TPR) repeat protein